MSFEVVVPVATEIVIDVAAVELAANKKKAMKRLTCRKCEGHQKYAILKGHAGVCPYKNCSCQACNSVMSMRANALIRRFRHRQPGQSMAVVKALRSKNGNMRLRIVARNEENVVETDSNATLVTYSNDKNGHQTYTTVGSAGTNANITPSEHIRRGSVMTVQSDDRDSVVSTPPSTTNNSTPSGSPPLLLPYGEHLDGSLEQMLALVRSFLIQNLTSNPATVQLTPEIVTFLLQGAPSFQCQPTAVSFEPANNLIPPMLFPTFLNGITLPSLSV